MITYRLATPSDYIKINEFHNQIDKPNRTIEQFYWEFRDCPFGPSIYVIAEDGDRIVGTNCVIPIQLIDSKGALIKSGKSEDTLVDPAYRGQNIFNNIYDFLFEESKKQGISLIWGFTSATKAFERLGFEIPFYHHQGLAVNRVIPSFNFLKSLNPKNGILNIVKILGLTIVSKLKYNLNLLPHFFEFELSENQRTANFSVKLIKMNLEESKKCFAIFQNEKFQKWRIYDNPNYYNIYSFTFKNKQEQVVAIIEINSTMNNVAYINQSTFDPSLSEKSKAKILRKITDQLFKKGIVIVRNWLFNTSELNKSEISVYEKAGFFYLNRGNGMVWKKLDESDFMPQDFYLSRIASQGIN
jgi:GNAT superfamily N-acetyltransferase